MAEWKKFAKEIRLIGRSIEENANKLTRKAALMVDRSVVMATPVDTGRARANWRVAIGEPNPEVLFPSPEKPPSKEAGLARAIAEGEEVVAGYTGEDDEIHISNNLPYIGPLNRGHSDQAGKFFVQTAVQGVAEKLKRANLITGATVQDE